MPTVVYDSDFVRADAMLIGPTQSLRHVIAECIAMERERCAQLVVSYLGATTESAHFGIEAAAAIRRMPSQNQTGAK